MKADKLAQAYLRKAQVRLESLHFFKDRKAYSDVVREAQELVELLLKAAHLHEIRRISKRLRKERELSFYGAEDFIPTEEYDVEDADHAIKDAAFVYQIVSAIFDQTEEEPA
uniref:DNA-binding protein n=1 Tax=Desulfacinum infernum TaxID=35837 RepID=A0A832A3P2_9BACT